MRASTRAGLLVSVVALGVSVPGSAFADDVYLTNGEVFEGVIAEVGESQVRIRLPVGAMSLPKSQVLRVEREETRLEQFLRRKGDLQESLDTSSRQWLDLARWAKLNDLEREHRQVILMLAELDPRLEGLEPFLRAQGYTLDEDEGRWISFRESKRRQGLLYHEGEWMTREERLERIRLREEERALREQALARARVAPPTQATPPQPEPSSEAIEALAQAQLELARGILAVAGPGGFRAPFLLGTGTFFHSGIVGRRTPFLRTTSGRSPWEQMVHRQPGSLIPVNHRHHQRP